MQRVLPLFALLAPLAAQDTARLEGLVLDAHERPVAAAAVTVERDGQVIGRTASDGLGYFVLGRLPHARLAVRAVTDAPDVGGAHADLRGSSWDFVTIALGPARRLDGRLLDARCEPVAAAFVAMAPIGPEAGGAVARSTRTDADGRFGFTHVPFGEVAVRCWRAGAAGIAATVDGVEDAALELAFGDDAPQERRFLLEDASPEQRSAAALEIRAFVGEAEVPLPPAVAAPDRADDGAWLVRGWPDVDEMRAHVRLSDALVEPVHRVIPPGGGDCTKSFWVERTEAAFVRGRLFAPDGTRVADRRLVAIGGWHGRDVQTFGTTRADGSFELLSPTPTGTTFMLRCLDDDLTLRPTRRMDGLWAGAMFEHRREQVLEVEASASRPLRAALRDALDLPCPSAEFVVLGETDGTSMALIGNGGFHPVRSCRVLARARSDRQGNVVLDAASFAVLEASAVTVLGPGGFLYQDVGWDGKGGDLGVLRVGAGTTILGSVRRPDDTPWPGARIELTNHVGFRNERQMVADRAGTFTLRGLGPGPTWIGIAGTKRGELLRLDGGETVEVSLW